MFSFPQPVYQQADTGGGGTNPFSAQTPAGGIVASGCHDCECELLFAQVMAKVMRVKNMCYDDVCRVEDFRSFRRRNMAISADYADIYLQPLGEAKRLKFAGGAAFGSTHIGYGMDIALKNLDDWGNRTVLSGADVVVNDEIGIGPDSGLRFPDITENGAQFLTGVTYAETLTGLRRLVYGNLAIYMDLGAVLWFCQMHEQRFNYFRDGRGAEFIDCFNRFVEYVKANHANDHPVYASNGSFGATTGGWLRNGLRALAENRVADSLTIIDHEQRTILQNYMYTLSNVPGPDQVPLGNDGEFKSFMNALEKVNWGSGYGADVRFQGIRAVFSALEDPFLLVDQIQLHGEWQSHPLPEQPLVYLYDRNGHGRDFTNPDMRTPWFKEVVAHFIKAEQDSFQWPSAVGAAPYRRIVFGRGGNSADISTGTPNLQGILYSDLGLIRSMG